MNQREKQQLASLRTATVSILQSIDALLMVETEEENDMERASFIGMGQPG